MNRIICLFSFSIIFLLFSCHGAKDTIVSDDFNERNSRDIFVSKNYFDDTSQSVYLKRFSLLLGLKDIRKMGNEFYVRVWLWGGYEDTTYVVNIDASDNYKQCDITAFGHKTRGDSSFLRVYLNQKKVQPSSGWDSLFFVISKNNIKELSDIDAFSQHPINGGATYRIEIAEANSYKQFGCFEPNFYRFISEESNKVNIFFMFLNRQFGVNVYHVTPSFFAVPDSVKGSNSPSGAGCVLKERGGSRSSML